MGALRIIAARSVLPETLQQHLQMESEIWVKGKTRTGKATLFTLTGTDFDTMYKKAIALQKQGLIDECRYARGGTRRSAVFLPA